MARGLVALLLAALVGVQVATAQTQNVRIPMLTWGQDENTLFLSATIPTPIDVNDVSFNDSHVKIDVLATDKEIPYFVEFELREDIQAKRSNWLVTRTGVKLVLKKAVPHRFDRLVVRYGRRIFERLPALSDSVELQAPSQGHAGCLLQAGVVAVLDQSVPAATAERVLCSRTRLCIPLHAQADPSSVPKHLIRVDWDEYMEEEDPIEQSVR